MKALVRTAIWTQDCQELMKNGFFDWSYKKDYNVFAGAWHDGDLLSLDTAEVSVRSVYPLL